MCILTCSLFSSRGQYIYEVRNGLISAGDDKPYTNVGPYCHARNFVTGHLRMAMDISNTPPFKAVDADPGGTLQRFDDYIEEMKLLFTLTFRKSDGTSYNPTDNEKKALMRL